MKPQLEFTCDSCQQPFCVDLDAYRGELDHPNGDCRCEPCKECEGRFVGRRWFPGTQETERYVRVVTGTGNTSERKELDTLCRALKVSP